MTSLYRIHPQPAFNFGGLVIDNFAGGGGASTGIEGICDAKAAGMAGEEEEAELARRETFSK